MNEVLLKTAILFVNLMRIIWKAMNTRSYFSKELYYLFLKATDSLDLEQFESVNILQE